MKVSKAPVRSLDCGYDFFGRDPVEWHEDVCGLVWFSSSVVSWDKFVEVAREEALQQMKRRPQRSTVIRAPLC